MIRPARPHDLPDLVRLVQALAAHHDDAATVSETSLRRDLFDANPWLQCLVADADGLQGYIALTQLARLQWGQRGMDIHHLFIAEPFRGVGLGSELVNAAAVLAQRLECSYLTVSALDTNVAAQAFYAKSGFSQAPVHGVRFARLLTEAVLPTARDR